MLRENPTSTAPTKLISAAAATAAVAALGLALLIALLLPQALPSHLPHHPSTLSVNPPINYTTTTSTPIPTPTPTTTHIHNSGSPTASIPSPGAALRPPPYPPAAAVFLLNLSGPSGPSWQLSNANGSIAELPIEVPGYPLTALRQAGLLGAPANDPRSDPLYRFNELQYLWVALDTWTLTTSFQMPPLPPSPPQLPFSHSSAAAGRPRDNNSEGGGSSSSDNGVGGGGGRGGGDGECGVDLLLEGVDTLGDVWLNGKHLARVKNFHRSHRLDVRELLRPPADGNNTLTIVLHPAAPYVHQQANSYPYPMPSNTAPGAFPHFAFLRKPASDFGWDWGPAFAAAGLHGAVRLVRYCAPYVAGLHVIEQRHSGPPPPPQPTTAPPATPPPLQHPTATATKTKTTSSYDSVVRLLHPGIGTVEDGAHHDDSTQSAIPISQATPTEAASSSPSTHGAITLRVEVEVWSPPSPSPPVPPLPPGDVLVVVELSGQGNAGGGGGGEGGVLARAETRFGASSFGRQFVELQMQLDASVVELWWPVGYGGQPLYTLAAWVATEAGGGGGGDGERVGGSGGGGGRWGWRGGLGGSRLRPQQRRVGLRTVELVTAPLEAAAEELSYTQAGGADTRTRSGGTEGGGGGDGPDRSGGERGWGAELAPAFPSAPTETFYLRVNGQPLFARGANLVPLSVLPTDPWVGGPAGLARLLAASLGAGMNMLRVWGGGRYQLDELYDMADGSGLLLWQEFMFACNPYPNTEEFVEEVRHEVSEQVRRLSGHPSVVVWGGNNEVEASFSWYPETRANPSLFAADFTALFVEAVRGVVEQLDPGRPYLDSSPASGLYSRLPYIKRWGDPQDPAAGDVHFYNYKDDCMDPSIYPRARFISEYGYQSFASYSAVRRYGELSDWAPLSAFMRHRQRHPDGEQELLSALSTHFRQPPDGWGANNQSEAETSSWTQAAASLSTAAASSLSASAATAASAAAGAVDGLDLYGKWIYQLQLQQSLCYSTALATWRSLRSDPATLTMGVLYWQLNDIWPAYSWASLDYGGGRKQLHSTLRRSYAPLALLAVRQPGGNVTAHVVNDSPHPAAVRLTVSVVSLAPYSTAKGRPRVAVVQQLQLTAPPQRSTLALNATPIQLLASLPGCSETTCVMHLRAVRIDVRDVKVAAAGEGSSGGQVDPVWKWGVADPADDEAVLMRMARWREQAGGQVKAAPAAVELADSTESMAAARAAHLRGEGAGASVSINGGSGKGRRLSSVRIVRHSRSNGSDGAAEFSGGRAARARWGDGASKTPAAAAAAGGVPMGRTGGEGVGVGGGAAAAVAAVRWDWWACEALVMLAAPKDLQLHSPGIEVFNITATPIALPTAAAAPSSTSNPSTSNPSVAPSTSDAVTSGLPHPSTTPYDIPRTAWCFSLRATRAAALWVALESDLAGDFSENLLPLIQAAGAAVAEAAEGESMDETLAAVVTEEAVGDTVESPGHGVEAAGNEGKEEGEESFVKEEGTATPGREGGVVVGRLYGSKDGADGTMMEGGAGGDGGTRVCFYTNEKVDGGVAGFRAALKVRELYGMQTW